ncbi:MULTISPECIES: DUF7344 domain-containing protein [Haloarcula]|uniref:DUF7344 domain-containing protein n=1 Tax=Haloarcula pellucida TaxID=1427151 RepID=A0A830GJJ8_9EURY|nr:MULTISPECIES: hypothetical protein [Halomicroarcula]MBX0350437.1 hypothetical protein [Halomicroarcula pellucida]MDS0278723.1 hypothetical protein [Halomicroarcula sp. S1AR25-4]GGN90976.1 hypothetical protein GCM10009030_13510 [Halomicroarcula pellucida]
MTQIHSDTDGTLVGAVELTDSDRHRLLTDERRRIALDVLSDRPGPVHLDELATEVATRESDTAMADPSAVERAAIALHHNHLPRLAASDIVEYDPETRQVH